MENANIYVRRVLCVNMEGRHSLEVWNLDIFMAKFGKKVVPAAAIALYLHVLCFSARWHTRMPVYFNMNVVPFSSTRWCIHLFIGITMLASQ